MTDNSMDDGVSAWTADRFLATVADRLGAPYHQCSDGWFRWLTPFTEQDHERHAGQARYALARLPQMIPGLDPRPLDGGWPAILFANQDDHLTYEGLFGGTGTSIISGGSWCSWPVGHLAIPVSQWDSVDAAFAHELVHAVLSDEGVPAWLQEGLATEVETRMGNRTAPLSDLHGLGETLAYWRSHAADPFWSSEAFRDPTSSEHAYRLAQVIAGRWVNRPQILQAIRTVGAERWADADKTLHELVGCDRAGLLAAILAPARQRGWLERVLFELFVGKAP